MVLEHRPVNEAFHEEFCRDCDHAAPFRLAANLATMSTRDADEKAG